MRSGTIPAYTSTTNTVLVDRLVAMRELDASDALRMPGHDKRADEGFFLHLEPTIIKFEMGLITID